MRREAQPLSMRQRVVLGVRAVGIMLTAAAAFEGVPAAPVAAASPGVEVSTSSSSRSGIRIPSVELNDLTNCQYFRDNLQPDGTVTKATTKIVSTLEGGNPFRVVEYRVSRYDDPPETGQVVVARHYGQRRVEAFKEDANNNPQGSEIVFNNVPSDRTVSVECADGSPNIKADAVKARTQVRRMDGIWEDTNPPHIFLPENVNLPDYKTIVQEESHPADCTCPVHAPASTSTPVPSKPGQMPVPGLPGSGNKIIQTLP